MPVRIPPEGNKGNSTPESQSLAETLVNLYQPAAILTRGERSGANDLVKQNLALTEKWLRQAYTYYQQITSSDKNISLVAEWMLDNYYILQQAIRLIKEDLPVGYQVQLPRLLDAPYKRFPRIFALCRSLLFHQSFLLDLDAFMEQINIFQEHLPLTMGELWSIPIFIRFALLEKVSQLLLEDINPAEKPDLPTFPPVFPGPDLAEIGQDHPERDQAEVMASIFHSLRLVSESDWEKIFESISLVDRTLREDPAGIYPQMDFKTRNLYRYEIEKLARYSGQEENHLARTLLEYCQRHGPGNGNQTSSTEPEHVGDYLVGSKKTEFERYIRTRQGLKARLKNLAKKRASALYLGSIGLTALGLFTLIVLTIHATTTFANIGFFEVLLMALITLGLIPPILIIASHLINILLTAILPPGTMPKMNFKDGVPDEYRTLVAIPGMIASTKDVDNLVRQLEIHYLSNPQPGLKFAILTDFADAPTEVRPEDEDLVGYANKAIENLNRKYLLAGTETDTLFFLFHRWRKWNESQESWMGWERKRGKLLELNQFLRGKDDTSFISNIVNSRIREKMGHICYVITMDADTILPPGSAVRLVGALAHPLNHARFDPATEQVTSGYTILQPRVEINPRSANQSWFTRIFAGDTGIDLYTHAVSDIYQDLFGEGIFVGKGIYEVDAMMRSVEGHVPENALLSHDLLEGILGRAGLVSDITLIEDYPLNYYEQVIRQRRWIRGDWQLLPWLYHPARFGVKLTAIDSWKILHNQLRSLLSPSLLFTVLLGIAFLPRLAWLWVVILLLAFGIPLVNALVNSVTHTFQRLRQNSIWPTLWPVVMRWLFAIAFLPYEAYYAADAILITLYRLFISHRRLLSWTTAEHASVLLRSKARQNEAWIKLSLSALIAILFVFFTQLDSILTNRTTILLQMPILPIIILWLLSSLLVRGINQPLPSPRQVSPYKDTVFLHLLARRTWGFFERFVGPQDHWLPPDHYQETPYEVIAHHTSPSNIGFFLTSAVGAYDFGYLDQLGLVARLETTLDTMMKLQRHRGHFLNWYNTQTLDPLFPRYVSTVDSGNLAISLVIMAQACRVIPQKRVFRWETFEGYQDNLGSLQEALSGIKKDHPSLNTDALQLAITIILNRIRAQKGHPAHWFSLYTFIGSNFWPTLTRNMTAFIATIPGDVELASINRLQEDIFHVEHHYNAIQHSIDELVPWIPLLESIPPLLLQEGFTPIINHLRVVLTYNPRLYQIPGLQKAASSIIAKLREEIELQSEKPGLSDNVTAAVNWLEELQKSIQHSVENAIRTHEQFGALETQAIKFVEEMDFTFLYNSQRYVFHNGFNLESGQLDNNYYDLLASEARIASLFAISRGQVPQSHWIHLSRPITRIKRDYALLSWSATMFEYLMPTLYLHSHTNTLLNTSVMTMVNYQKEYAIAKGVPWGISESGFYQFDINKNYQYRAFGVPALGFKRGLAEDLVIAPYASFMAIKWAPSAVEENARKLIASGAYGLYGFYESIDFTRERVDPIKKYEVIQEYMSHHQGMILMALDNYLHEEIMVNRVHQDPQIQSVDLLLQEQVPTGVPLLMPGEDETRGIQRISDTKLEIAPWPEPVKTPSPRMLLLSNGAFSSMLSNHGGGFLRWKDIDLTRWRTDGVLDPWGMWIYIQDLQRKDNQENFFTWSAAEQPIPGNTDDMQVHYFPHMAVYRRTQNDLTSTMEITVAAEEALEIRRIHLINNSISPRHIRLTSYGEVVLNHQAKDIRHPAFNKLFVESEWVPELNLEIFTHRNHDEKVTPVFLGHMLVIKENRLRKNEGLQVGFETDRRAFLGREHSMHNPVALQSAGYLTGTTGATLDPIFSLGREIYLRPHDTYRMAFLTFSADSRNSLLKLAERYQVWTKIDDAFIESNTANLIWLGRQEVERDNLIANMDLLSSLVYPQIENRADAKTLSENVLNQSGLWRFGISGDYPIILVELEDPDQLNLLVEAVEAQSFLRSRGYETDLVVLSTKTSMYNSEFIDLIVRRIQLADAGQWVDQRTGIFVRSADQMPAEELILLRAVARVLLKGSGGPLVQQLKVPIRQAAELPPLNPIQSSRRDLPAEPAGNTVVQQELQFENGYGGFSQDGKEYIVHLEPGKTTPSPWVNVVGYPHFGFMVTQSGSQTTWSLNSGENRLSPWPNDPIIDPSGEVLYLRDEETGDIWTPTPRPIPAPHPYRVRHGSGYSIFESESHGLVQEMTLLGSPIDPVKIIHLKVYNRLNSNRRLTATYYLDWVLGTTHEETYPYLVPGHNAKNAMLYVRNPYHPELGKRIAFLMANRALHGFTTDRQEFFGNCGSIEDPAALHRIGLTGSLEVGEDSCAVIQLHIDLLPNASGEIYFILGEARNEEELASLAKRYRDPDMIAFNLKLTHAFWENLLTRIQVETPEPAVNLMLNRWWLYQTLSCRIWGRTGLYQSSGAFGFRDQLQDVMALLNVDPTITRGQILNAAQHQFEEGDVLHWWHPPSGRGVRTRISDNLIWLPYVMTHYAAVTGDASIWEEKLPFLRAPVLKPEESERYGEYEHTRRTYSLFEHCRRALEKGSTIGTHGLPLIGSGDWNDGFNQVGSQGKGESIWLAWFLVDTLNRFADVCEQRGLTAESAIYRDQSKAYLHSLEGQGWDGDWYRRAYCDDGTALGSQSSEECQIDSIAQSWAVLSGGGETDRAKLAMDAVWNRLVDRKNDLSLLFTPPFEHSKINPGYIMDYPPGVRENGGQYTHASAWSAWSYAKLGDSERAWQLFNMLNPIHHAEDETKVNQYRVEPYVSVADIYSQDPHVGRGGWTWYTGSSAWLYRTGIEALLGFRREITNLIIDPVIPAEWNDYSIQYRYLNTVYHIKVHNPEHVSQGVKTVKVDGQETAGNKIGLVDDGSDHEIEVTLGH